jgi:hypothetical protein
MAEEKYVIKQRGTDSPMQAWDENWRRVTETGTGD